jgi:hypothetical protein
MYNQDETPERPGMQNGNNGSSNKMAPASSYREDNRGVQQEGFRTGVPETSKRDVQRVTKDQELDLAEWSTPSEKNTGPKRY